MIDPRVRRGELNAQQEIGSSPGIDRLIQVIPAQGQFETEVGGIAIPECGSEQGIVGQIILGIVHRIGERKEVVWPFQLFSQGNRNPEILQRVTITKGLGMPSVVIPPCPETTPVKTTGQRVSFLTSQPGLRKREVIGLVSFTIGLNT